MKVFVSSDEINEFRKQWPCSNLPTDTGITFEYATNGDLVDITLLNGVDSEQHDGPAMVTLSKNAQARVIGRELFPGGKLIRDAMRKSEFVGAYIEALFFTESDNLDGCTVDDFSFDLARSIIGDCAIFEAAHGELIADDLKQAGHDFWLTRNGHGAGFWDGDWPKEIGEQLTRTSKAFGESTVYKGDCGMLYN